MADERINLFLLGIGNVGQTVIQQIYARKLPIRICGIARSTTMVTAMNDILIDGSSTSLETALETHGEPLDLSKFIKSAKISRSVLVDCTANPEVANQYVDAIKKKIPVVTSNKLANSQWSYKNYTKLREESRKRNIPYLYETTVGAGLPVIHTLHGLLNSGDQIRSIQAVLSGSLSYIFNTLAESGGKFSDIVRKAQEAGYTEPNPWEDLSGNDVQRKLIILAREIRFTLETVFRQKEGPKWELKNINVKPPVSKSLDCPQDKFWNRLPEQDAAIEEFRAKDPAKKPAFIASLVNKGGDWSATAQLETVGVNSPFYSLSGSDNMISFTTDRYPAATPLVVRGPGAGAQVTAGGVLANIFDAYGLN